jgi:hypothetical protein
MYPVIINAYVCNFNFFIYFMDVQVDEASDGAEGAKFPEAEVLHRWRIPSPFLLQWSQL